MRKLADWGVFGVVALMGACAAPYKEPTIEPKATIEFVDDAAYKMSVHFHGGAEACTDRTSAGFVEARSNRTLNVPAGKPLVLTVGMDAGYRGQISLGVGGAVGAAFQPAYKGCTPTVEFVPEVGKAYVFRMRSNGSDCTHQFYTSHGAEAGTSVVFSTREWVRAAGEAGPWCKARG